MTNKDRAIAIGTKIADEVQRILTSDFPIGLSKEKGWEQIMQALNEAEVRGMEKAAKLAETFLVGVPGIVAECREEVANQIRYAAKELEEKIK